MEIGADIAFFWLAPQCLQLDIQELEEAMSSSKSGTKYVISEVGKGGKFTA